MMCQVIVVVKRASTDVTDKFFYVKVNIQMLRESAFCRISVLTVTARINYVFVSIDVSSQNRWMTKRTFAARIRTGVNSFFVRSFSVAVKCRPVKIQSFFGIANEGAIWFATRNVFVVVDVYHVIHKAAF
jgi:hypothetical protein